MKRLLSQLAASILGLWVATLFVPSFIVRAYPTSNFFGFHLGARWEIILFLGIVLGLLNYFLRPLSKSLSLPLEVVSLELFNILVNIAFLWLLDLIFDELYVPFFFPLLYTALIIWGLNIIGLFLIKKY